MTYPQLIFNNSNFTQRYPDVIYLNNGSFIVVWQQKALINDTTGFDIWIKFPGSDPKIINTYNISDQVNPRIIQLKGMGYAVIWESNGRILMEMEYLRGN